MLMLSCSKHDLSDSSKNVAQMSNQERAKLVMDESYQILGSIEKHVFVEKSTKEMLRFERYKNSANKSLEEDEIPLPDFFAFYEGFVNYQWSDLLSGVMEVGCDVFSENVEVNYDSDNNVYTISFSEIEHIFDQLEAMLQNNFQDGYDHVKLIDFDLLGIDGGGNAEIQIKACVAVVAPAPPPPPLFFVPSDDVWATQKIGWCPTTDNVNWDAANFVNSYANTKTWPRQNPCPPGEAHFFAGGAMFNTYGGSFNFSYDGNQFWNHIYPNVWKGQQNICLPGSDNNYWHSLYNGIDNIIPFATQRIQSFTLFQNFELAFINYHSHWQASQWDPLDPHFHGGEFFFALITCN
jgi:hypothetical protein